MIQTNLPLTKPLLRGHFHQAAFFLALGACLMLVAESRDPRSVLAMTIYSVGLVGLFGISALYHRPQWSPQKRLWMKRLDHAAIFVMIAGTGTPLALLAIAGDKGSVFLAIVWGAAFFGVFQSLIWVTAPKWLKAGLYILMGWLALPYAGELQESLGLANVVLLILGGAIYTVGALVYAFRKPNPWPRVFGYHELFHLLTILAATCHFVVIAELARR